MNAQSLILQITSQFPEFKIVAKKDSFLMKAIHVFLLIITLGQLRVFMSNFITVVGYTMYTGASWDGLSDKSQMVILRHERVHLGQRKRLGLWFTLSYLFFPFPVVWAYYRMKYEMEAYEEGMRARWEYFGKAAFNIKRREHTIKLFTGASYFWTWPWKKRIEEWYDGAVTRLGER